MKRNLYSSVIQQRNNKEDQERKANKIRKQYKLDNDKEVVVINESKGTRLLKIISYKFQGLVKIIFWLILMGVMSIGATVLLNPSLREQFLNIFK